MISNLALTSDQIEKAVEAVKKRKPVYADLLDFHGRIFDAQEDSKGRIQIEPLQISEAMLSVKAREQLPLIGIEEFVYDDIESSNLFITICNLAKEANPKLAASAKVILKAVDAAIKPNALFSGLINGNEALFENITDEFEIDKDSLQAAMLNILENAIEACIDDQTDSRNLPLGQVAKLPAIRFAARVDQEKVLFRIQDNGKGMDKATLKNIFTIFFSSKGNKGTGLGLFIANKVISQHRGEIKVVSTKNQGTRFIIKIPRSVPRTAKNPRGIPAPRAKATAPG